jgi:hypothetical protein
MISHEAWTITKNDRNPHVTKSTMRKAKGTSTRLGRTSS